MNEEARMPKKGNPSSVSLGKRNPISNIIYGMLDRVQRERTARFIN